MSAGGQEIVLRVRVEAPRGVRVRVEPEIVHADADAGVEPQAAAASLPRRAPVDRGDLATERQAGYVYHLGRQAGQSRAQFGEWLTRLFGVQTSYQLRRDDVDRAIRMLKQQVQQRKAKQDHGAAAVPEDHEAAEEDLQWGARG